MYSWDPHRFSKEAKKMPKTGYEDRFIRGPELVQRISHQIAVMSSPKPVSKDNILYKELHSEAREEYKRLIDKTGQLKHINQGESWKPQWPVRYRSKPTIGVPDIILDLPEASQSFCNTTMDWSVTNCIAVAFPRCIYLWDAVTASTSVIHALRTTCIKWSPCGRYLFTANKSNDMLLMDLEKRVRLTVKPPVSACHSRGCQVTCTTFHPSKPLVITGCNKGGVTCYVMKRGLKGMIAKDWYTDAVTQLKYNCNGHYFAVTTMSGWVGIAPLVDSNIMEFQLRSACKALAWHPWNPKLVVVGDMRGTMYAYQLTGANTMDCVASYHCGYNAAILALSFNPITAELVVSQRVFSEPHDPYETDMNDEDGGETFISVLASFDRVVDRMMGHTGCVHVLCWSPDGQKLASSGTDETARIWSFIDKTKIPKQREESRRKELMKIGHSDFKAFTLR